MEKNPVFTQLDATGLDPARKHLPLWLLDIDGVLNAFEHPLMQLWRTPGIIPAEEDAPAEAFLDYERHRVPTSGGSSFIFVTSPTLIRNIVRLHESRQVEIGWLTTWQQDAVDEVSPILGLPAFPVVGWSDGGWSWKTEAAMEALQLNRPIVWTDDDAITSEAEAVYRESPISHLLLAPEATTGLTPTHMTMIETFVRQV